MEPTSPNAERITMQAQPGQAQGLRPEVVSTPSAGQEGENYPLLQRINEAIFVLRNWKFDQDDIGKLDPHSYKQLIEVPAFNAAGITNALYFIISNIPTEFAVGFVPDRTHPFNAVKALVKGAPSDELREKMINWKSPVDGTTPLHLVTASKFEDSFRSKLVEYLLGKGAIAATTDNQRRTPLHLAAMNLCEYSIRTLLKHLDGQDHTLYDINFSTPLDLALAARQAHMAGTTGSIEPRSSAPKTYQSIMNCLEDYQEQKKGVPNLRHSSRSKYDSSNAYRSGVHVLESTGPYQNAQATGPNQVSQNNTFRMTQKCVNDVLYGSTASSILGELRRQTMDVFSRAGIQPAPPLVVPEPGPRVTTSGPYVTVWIHLPAHNVCNLTFWISTPLRIFVLSSTHIIC